MIVDDKPQAPTPAPVTSPVLVEHMSLVQHAPVIPTATPAPLFTAVVPTNPVKFDVHSQSKGADPAQSSNDTTTDCTSDQIDRIRALLKQHNVTPTTDRILRFGPPPPNSQPSQQPTIADTLAVYKQFIDTIDDDAVTNIPVLSAAGSDDLSEIDDGELHDLGAPTRSALAEQTKDDEADDFASARVPEKIHFKYADSNVMSKRKVMPLKSRKRLPLSNVGSVPTPGPVSPIPIRADIPTSSDRHSEDIQPRTPPKYPDLNAPPEFAPGWEQFNSPSGLFNESRGDHREPSVATTASSRLIIVHSTSVPDEDKDVWPGEFPEQEVIGVLRSLDSSISNREAAASIGNDTMDRDVLVWPADLPGTDSSGLSTTEASAPIEDPQRSVNIIDMENFTYTDLSGLEHDLVLDDEGLHFIHRTSQGQCIEADEYGYPVDVNTQKPYDGADG